MANEVRLGLLSGSGESILELGVGVGANWDYLPRTADYVGIEPDEAMLLRAQRRAQTLGRAMPVEQARAEELPFDDAQFDTVLVTLTLCSVQEPARALAEAKRVLKPGGSLVFVEHVRPKGRVGGWLADRMTPAWRRIGAGCHPNRNTAEAIAAAGFQIEAIDQVSLHALPMIAGIARKPPA